LRRTDNPVTTNASWNSIGRSEATMFNPTKIVIQAFVVQLQQPRTYLCARLLETLD
jgi:hypothetical protein